MHRFEEVDDVLSTLQKLMQREPALAAALPRQPGMKEIRYAHLLSGEPEAAAALPVHPASDAGGSDRERILRLEAEVAKLREDLDAVQQELHRRSTSDDPAQPENG
jgi:hypothetical protein